jgi:hypothetical protein
MGHSLIGKLPATRSWKAVVSLIASGANAATIAAQTARAANKSLTLAANDPVLKQVTLLLARVPLAARQDDFTAALRALGLDVSQEPTLVEICAAITEHLDDLMRKRGRRNDFGEIAQTALVESFSAVAGRSMPLLGVTSPADDARIALAALATLKQFGGLARDFFTRLTRRCLDYYLSRELPNHVGLINRFHSLREHADFADALELHCHETSRIVQTYAGEWFSKTEYERGIGEADAGSFAKRAFSKITKELGMRAGNVAHA